MYRSLLLILVFTLLTACSNDQSGSLADPEVWPQGPVRVIIPFGAGGLADVTVRMAGERLSETLGRALVIENRPGAGGVAATSTMLNSAADGHTLIVLTNGTSIAETQFPDLPYDIRRDLQPVSALVWFDLVLLSGADTGIGSLGGLLARARENGEIRIATINPGSTQHLSAELFKRMAGIEATIITYRTTPDVLGALMRGEVELAIDSYTALKGAIDGGQASILAVTGSERNPALPNVPTVAEAGVPGYVVEGWNALYTHAETDPLVIERLQLAMQQVTAETELLQRFAELGVVARTNTPAEMRARFDADVEKWRGVMQDAGLIP